MLEELLRGTQDVYSKEEFEKKLKTGKPLKVKAGFDPTAPDLHLGHTVLLNKLRQFQEAGHEVLFLIGDFTAKIGDPSGRSKTRPPLSDDDIKKNVQTYCEQVFKVLDKEKTKIVYNSEWLDKLGVEGIIKLTSQMTVARMLERDDFAKRYQNNQPISIHEFLYPLLQGYDSVALEADVELGGTDQIFNLLVGRQLQKDGGQAPQIVLTMPLLEGTDGVKKMSKSYDNYIGIFDAPIDMFGKVLSISDELMWRYYELLSFKPLAEIQKMKTDCESGAMNPKLAKVALAREIVERFHSAKAADEAEAHFEKVFSGGGIPDEVEEFEISLEANGLGILQILSSSGLTSSNGEARRMIQQNAVKLNQEKIIDPKVVFSEAGEYLFQVGKRKFKKIILK
jgi:tyrosyl-tRNA synthetase